MTAPCRRKEGLKCLAASVGVGAGLVASYHGMYKNEISKEQSGDLHDSIEFSIDEILLSDKRELPKSELDNVYDGMLMLKDLSYDDIRLGHITTNIRSINKMYDSSNAEHRAYLRTTLLDTRSSMREIRNETEQHSSLLYVTSSLFSAIMIGVCGAIALKKFYSAVRGEK